jgi:ankyrin repeat protein
MDLEEVKQLVAEGADVAEADNLGYTALLEAARFGNKRIMHWLLTEGGSSLTERTLHGRHALMIAARMNHLRAMQYLLEERGAPLTKSSVFGDTEWGNIDVDVRTALAHSDDLTSLLKVMVMLEDAPADFIANPRLSPQHADICARGRQFRAQLLSYLEQQQTAIVAHCPLPAVLQSLVAAYAATNPKDMWTDGLRVEV